MPTLGTNIAIFADNKVLLTLRKDFEVWCLPGGHIDQHEGFGQCAIREAYEETGLEVKLTRFVGSYNRLNWRDGLHHIHLFNAEVVGGMILPQPEEVLDIQYFPVSALPKDMFLAHRHRIIDASRNLIGVVKTEDVEWPFPHIDRAEVYHMMESSELQPADFYNKYFPSLKPEQIIIEVAGHRHKS